VKYNDFDILVVVIYSLLHKQALIKKLISIHFGVIIEAKKITFNTHWHVKSMNPSIKLQKFIKV